MMLEPLLSYEQLSAELDIPVRTLREMVYAGIIPHLRLGHRTVKFQRSRVERALLKREVKEVSPTR